MSESAVRVFVGTDARQGVAERALERSATESCSRPVEFVWMRQGDPGFTCEWSKQKWATQFTGFRWMVPELAGFHGRAIYLDSDMVVLGDLAELVDWTFPGAVPCISTPRPDVIVFDCARFDGMPRWPSKEEILGMTNPMRLRSRCGIRRVLPSTWDSCDVMAPNTKLLHFTRMVTQPWKPWPERHDYQEHPFPAAVDCFWSWANAE